MLFFGIADFVYKTGTAAGAAARHLVMVQAWVAFPFVIGFGLATGTLSPHPAALWGVGAGVLAYAGFYNFARSLADGDVSVNGPIMRMSFVVTALLAVVVLGEAVSVAKITGLALAIAATLALMGRSVLSPEASSRRSIVRVLIATAAVGTSSLLHKVGLGAGGTPASMLAGQAMAMVLISTAVTRLADGHVRPGFAALKQGSIAAIVLTIAFLCLLEGLTRGEASILVPISQMGFIVTALLGVAIHREKVGIRQAIGLVGALAALTAFAMA